MYRFLALGMLLIATGCAGEPASSPAVREPLGEDVTAVDAPVDLAVPQNEPPSEYPEKADVQRLLVRASELESHGRFEDALAVANQAVAIDPSSPSANGMKTRLEELLTRIDGLPQLDERAGAPT